MIDLLASILLIIGLMILPILLIVFVFTGAKGLPVLIAKMIHDLLFPPGNKKENN